MDLQLGSTKLLIDECRRQGLLRNQCAYVLATSRWETGGSMKPVKETTSKKNPNPSDAQVKRILTRAWKAGKLPWVKKDYWSGGYFGRGFVQLTHQSGYEKAGGKLGVDFVANPSLVMDLKYAIPICVTGMKEGWFTGKKLADYLTASKSDFEGARRIINGVDKKKEIAKLARDYEMDLQVTGYAQKPASTKPAPAVTIPAIEPKPAPAPVPASDKEMIRRVQTALTLLKYNPGGADGIIGPLTAGAIRIFRADNKLPEGDFIDDELISALANAKPREMVPARANATGNQVAAVVPEANAHWWNKWIGGGAGGGLGAAALVDAIAPTKGYMEQIRDLFTDVPGYVFLGVGAVLLLVVAYLALHGQKASDEAYRAGDRR